jgi:hypothetical protein
MSVNIAWHCAVIIFVEIRDRVPETWEPMTDVCETYTVSKDSEEYGTVANEFKNDFECEIINIKRIQHTHLWTSYVQKRAALSLRNGGHANEILYLKHGTQRTTPETIYASDRGVDPNCASGRYQSEETFWVETESGQLINVDEQDQVIKKIKKRVRANFYGPGSYFTASTKYACKYAHIIDNDTRESTRELILCRMVAGNIDEREDQDSTLRNPKMGCHSVKGPVYKKKEEPRAHEPQAHVVYDEFRSYPDYVVRFRYQK